MDVLLQWSNARQPGDWLTVAAADWAQLAWQPEPSWRQLWTGQRPGYVNALNVQGVVFEGHDHYAVEEQGGNLTVTVWVDNAAVKKTTGPWADVWTFRPLAPRQDLGGAIDTQQTRVVYGDRAVQQHFGPIANVSYRAWRDFTPPPAALQRHGVYLADDVFRQHQQRRRGVGYAERPWTNHLPGDELLPGGRLPPQRALGRWPRASHTKTYYLSNTAQATGIGVWTNEDAMLTTTSGAATLSDTIGPGATVASFFWATQASNPNDANWPNGTYRAILAVATAGANLTYGGSTLGLFSRCNSTIGATLETKVPDTGDQSGTGTKTLTVAWDPAAGATTDRWAYNTSVKSSAAHGNQSISITVNDGTSYSDGPWPVPIDYVLWQRSEPFPQRRAVVSY